MDRLSDWCCGPSGMMVLFLKHVHLQNLCAADGKESETCAVDRWNCAASCPLTGGRGQSYECGKEEHEEMNSRHGDSGRICGPMHLETAAVAMNW